MEQGFVDAIGDPAVCERIAKACRNNNAWLGQLYNIMVDDRKTLEIKITVKMVNVGGIFEFPLSPLGIGATKDGACFNVPSSSLVCLVSALLGNITSLQRAMLIERCAVSGNGVVGGKIYETYTMKTQDAPLISELKQLQHPNQKAIGHLSDFLKCFYFLYTRKSIWALCKKIEDQTEFEFDMADAVFFKDFLEVMTLLEWSPGKKNETNTKTLRVKQERPDAEKHNGLDNDTYFYVNRACIIHVIIVLTTHENYYRNRLDDIPERWKFILNLKVKTL